jgi:hypothetical protein
MRGVGKLCPRPLHNREHSSIFFSLQSDEEMRLSIVAAVKLTTTLKVLITDYDKVWLGLHPILLLKYDQQKTRVLQKTLTKSACV